MEVALLILLPFLASLAAAAVVDDWYDRHSREGQALEKTYIEHLQAARKITISPEVAHPARILVETAWLEQLAEEAQTAAQMAAGLAALKQDSDCGKFAAVICERVQGLQYQLEQMMEE